MTDDKGATGTTTRSVTVADAPPPANAAPTASFTAATNGLDVSVDGSGSADTDGTIAAYSWNWGDNSAAGSGATATHTYAAGTYTITLTVTDDKGATGTTTQSVTVGTVTPPPATPIAADDFNRALTGTWGTATTGGAWTSSSSTNPGYYSVDGAGKLTTSAPSQAAEVYLRGVTSTRSEVTAVIRPGAVPTGGTVYAAVIGRRVSSTDYRARIQLNTTGAVGVQFQAAGTTIGGTTAISGLTFAAGDALQVRFQVVGTSPTTLNVKVWKVGTPEPAAWQKTITDTTAALQTAGSFGLGIYSSATNTPYTLAYDDYAVTTVP
ncbi:PKD domain-containing protein [Naasia aerilata]|uniref:PKD domain-containing protein n=1 Tax=Naasia aerilata TaxID=1162966 RepID=A0ABM8GCF3_9MICO|nr:PKD domain-containing protein [Naasia aerilata]BDZ45932.1 hypothetical protein GCM10025866_18410 [Naasia aerilata]